MKAIQDSVKASRSHETVLENSYKGTSKSNGRIERAIQTVAAQMRTLRSCMEERIKERIPRDSTIPAWMVEHAANLITCYHIGSDGFVAYHKIHGKKA